MSTDMPDCALILLYRVGIGHFFKQVAATCVVVVWPPWAQKNAL